MDSLYDVLGITPRLSSDSIRRLRGVLAREYAESGSRPDGARMAAINAAIDVLGDEERRRTYDAEHGIEAPEDVDAAAVLERLELERRLAALPLDRNLVAVTIVLGAAFGVIAWWLGFVLAAAAGVFWWHRAQQRAALREHLVEPSAE